MFRSASHDNSSIFARGLVELSGSENFLESQVEKTVTRENSLDFLQKSLKLTQFLADEAHSCTIQL
jgi:hypothetical protein